MATLIEALENAKKLNQLRSLLITYIRKTEVNWITANKEQLFQASSDIFGNPIGYYSKATEEISGGQKREGEPFTSVDTGNFFKGFYIKVDNNKIMFGSTDSKTDEILKSKHWLSHELFGLTDENLAEIIENNILPYLQLESRKQLDI